MIKLKQSERLAKGIASKPVIIRGVEYPSRKIASEVLQVSPSTITMAEKRNSLDYVGLGKTGRKPNH